MINFGISIENTTNNAFNIFTNLSLIPKCWSPECKINVMSFDMDMLNYPLAISSGDNLFEEVYCICVGVCVDADEFPFWSNSVRPTGDRGNNMVLGTIKPNLKLFGTADEPPFTPERFINASVGFLFVLTFLLSGFFFFGRKMSHDIRKKCAFYVQNHPQHALNKQLFGYCPHTPFTLKHTIWRQNKTFLMYFFGKYNIFVYVSRFL